MQVRVMQIPLARKVLALFHARLADIRGDSFDSSVRRTRIRRPYATKFSGWLRRSDRGRWNCPIKWRALRRPCRVKRMEHESDYPESLGDLGMRRIGRREFIRAAAALSAAGVVLLGPHAWAARSLAGDGNRKRLVVVFLRGAVDGLNVVVPYGDANYYEKRPTIAIPRAGGDDAVLDLDGHFGLNPALNSMMPLWQDGTLAFVHACRSRDASRSHFRAQDYMESGTPGVKSTSDGWMNSRAGGAPGQCRADRGGKPPGPIVPRILSGADAGGRISAGAARRLQSAAA